MPFMRGVAPVRRTIKYLKRGNFPFKDNIKVITINFNPNQPASQGTKDLVFWHFAQMQYKNPHIQMCVFHDMTPSPFLQFFFESGEKMVLDVDNMPKDTILTQMRKIFCKTKEQLEEDRSLMLKQNNPANFGYQCTQECICEVPGQVPCTRWQVLPKELRGKYYFQKKDWPEEEE